MWKPEYAEKRRIKYHSDTSEREKRKSQSRSPEENREYMRQYYLANKGRFKPSAEQRSKNNASRRAKYAACDITRDKLKGHAKKWSRDNPQKKLSQRLKQYGLTVDSYERMRNGQSGMCAICLTPPRRGRLYVDHCHKSGRVRGLLCSDCNLGLGKFNDDADRVLRASKYLEAHACK